MQSTMTKPITTGLAGFLCEVTEETVTFQECLACAQNGAPGCPMIPAVIHDIVSSIRDPEYANKHAKNAGADVGFSATELLGCPRQFGLKKQYSYWEKPTAMYRMTFGAGYHAALAKYPGGIREKTLSWKLQFLKKSIFLIGTPDYFEATPGGWFILDYKETGRPPSARKVQICVNCDLELKPGEDGPACPNCGPLNPRSASVARVTRPPEARSSHAMQVNIYALLIEKNAALLQKEYQVTAAGFAGAQIVYLSPRTPVRCSVTLDKDATLACLKSQLTALLSESLPPVINRADELWRCDYCPVRAHCEQLHSGPVGKAAIGIE